MIHARKINKAITVCKLLFQALVSKLFLSDKTLQNVHLFVSLFVNSNHVRE